MKKYWMAEQQTLGYFTLLIYLGCIIHNGMCEEHHRIQRRFMWKQMDNTMGGLMGRMFSGARVMKHMIGDFLPTLSTTAANSKSMLDYLPTETTRVKYIIRNPHTNKPMKIIKMRGTKKVVKLMPLPKPITAEQQHANEPAIKLHLPVHNNAYENRIHELEKHQEMIAEGKLPELSDKELQQKYFQDLKQVKHNSREQNDVVSGRIMEYASWKPIYRPGESPKIDTSSKAFVLSHLNTDIGAEHESLPKPEKLVYEPPNDESDENENELAKQMQHTYEVTEHTAEESASHEVISEMPKETLTGGFVPSHGFQQQKVKARTKSRERTRPSAQSTSTSTEPPNYPPAFLKKYQELEQKGQLRSRAKTREKYDTESGSSWQSAQNLTGSLRTHHHHHHHHPQHQFKYKTEAAGHDSNENWPMEVKTYVTIMPSAVAFDQPTSLKLDEAESSVHPRKSNNRQRNIRQRGTIKFGDKVIYDEI